MANFSKRINIDKDTTPFQSIIFGSNAPLLEVELNEAQVLLSNMIRRLSSIVGYYSQSGITFTFNANDLSVDFKMSGTHILNGYVFNIPDGFSINVPYGYRLYLKIEEVDVDRNSQLYNNGIVQSGNEIDNTIVDDRYSMETSMRRSLCITPTITKSSNPGDEYFYVGSSNKDDSIVNADYFSDTILSQIQDIKDVIKDNVTQLDLRIDEHTHEIADVTGLQSALDGKADLDSTGKVPASQLPSYVDDVIDGYLYNNKFYKESSHATEINGETSKIYIDLPTGKTYRWSGSAFVVISETLALGETSSTAYRGDRGKTAYDHSQTAHAPSNAQENIIETVKVNDTALKPVSKTLNIKTSGNISFNEDTFSLSQNCIYMGDLNDAVFTGYYRGYNLKNAPESDCWLFGFTISSDVNNVRQVFWKFAGNNVVSMTLNDRYERVRCNGEWGEWTNTSVRKAVPKDAIFTDTTYVAGRGIGIDKDEYNQNRINFLDTCVGVSDWNNADKSGFYIGYGAENSPTTGGFYYGIVIAQSTKTVRQVVWQFAVADGATKTTYNKYEREKENGTWRDWVPSNTWRPLGTGADTACAGNDSRLSDARQASDVYAWAKASEKPSYTWDEIGSKPSYADQLALNGNTLESKNDLGDSGGFIDKLSFYQADFYSGSFYGIAAQELSVSGHTYANDIYLASNLTVNPNGTIKIGDHYVYAEEPGTWSPSNIVSGPTDTSVYDFRDSKYRKIGDIVILTTTATPTNELEAKVNLVIAKDSFPIPLGKGKIVSTFSTNHMGHASIGKISDDLILDFGEYTFNGGAPSGLNDVDVGIIYLL